jgi:hypothetical protein
VADSTHISQLGLAALESDHVAVPGVEQLHEFLGDLPRHSSD